MQIKQKPRKRKKQKGTNNIITFIQPAYILSVCLWGRKNSALKQFNDIAIFPVYFHRFPFYDCPVCMIERKKKKIWPIVILFRWLSRVKYQSLALFSLNGHTTKKIHSVAQLLTLCGTFLREQADYEFLGQKYNFHPQG